MVYSRTHNRFYICGTTYEVGREKGTENGSSDRKEYTSLFLKLAIFMQNLIAQNVGS